MKRYIILVAVLALAANAFAQTSPWPFIWGTAGSFVGYACPYDADGYIYDPSSYTWEHGTETGKSYFTVTCDIEMYMSMHFDATDIYFHIADDRTSMSAYVNGWLASNNGQWLFVSSELDTKDLTKLFFIEDIFGRDRQWYIDHGRPMPNDIPVEWFLMEPGDADWRVPQSSQSGNNGQLWGLTWLLANGEPCTHSFQIKIRITPEFHQPDGRYEMDPLVTAAPVL
ncbi:hypothetical protein JXJ21_17185 [candidate division KSB1 bacterium]|nr:hypothetical protein [candidate division KSB1 bacterium]